VKKHPKRLGIFFSALSYTTVNLLAGVALFVVVSKCIPFINRVLNTLNYTLDGPIIEREDLSAAQFYDSCPYPYATAYLVEKWSNNFLVR